MSRARVSHALAAVALVFGLAACATATGPPRPTTTAATPPAAVPAAARAACPRRTALSAGAPVRIGSGAGALAVVRGNVWVARPAAGTVTRVGPGGGRVITIGRGPVALAAAPGRLWVALRDGDQVAGIDTTTLRRLPGARLPVPVALTYGPTGLWALSLDASALYPLDPRTGSPGADLPSPVGDPAGMVTVGDELWLLGAQDGGVSPVDARLGRVVRLGFHLPGRALAGLSGSPAGGGSVWLAEPDRHDLLRVETSTVAVHELPAPGGMKPVATAVGACGVWVGGASGTVALVDATTGAALAPPVRIGRTVAALAAAGATVWASDPVDGTVVRVTAAGG